MRRNLISMEYPAEMFECPSFKIFDDKTMHWSASWIMTHANLIARQADGDYEAAWAAALQGLRDGEAALEDTPDMLDADDELVFLDESVEIALTDYFFGKGN